MAGRFAHLPSHMLGSPCTHMPSFEQQGARACIPRISRACMNPICTYQPGRRCVVGVACAGKPGSTDPLFDSIEFKLWDLFGEEALIRQPYSLNVVAGTEVRRWTHTSIHQTVVHYHALTEVAVIA